MEPDPDIVVHPRHILTPHVQFIPQEEKRRKTVCLVRTARRFQTEGGSLVIVAADGGNAASLEPFHTPECTLFSGMAVIYLRSTGSLGKTVLRAESDGLCSTELVFNAKNICLTAGIRKKMTAR